MKKLQKYVEILAEDGTEFETAAACLSYETSIKSLQNTPTEMLAPEALRVILNICERQTPDGLDIFDEVIEIASIVRFAQSRIPAAGR